MRTSRAREIRRNLELWREYAALTASIFDTETRLPDAVYIIESRTLIRELYRTRIGREIVAREMAR